LLAQKREHFLKRSVGNPRCCGIISVDHGIITSEFFATLLLEFRNLGEQELSVYFQILSKAIKAIKFFGFQIEQLFG
jgi:hypothetical protein